ncbi:Uncharacterised protein [Mycobacteroides abscessus]|nr:Uncharacterised protein [Mycobacteroides abscessus]
MGDHKHHILRRAGTDDGDTQWRFRGQIERGAVFTLRQHGQPQLLCGTAKVGHIVLDPSSLQIAVQHGDRMAIGTGMDRGAQRRVTKHDRGDRRTQLVYIEFTVEPIGPAQVHQNWRHTVCEPDTVLPRGQGHRGYTEAYRRFPAGNAHLDVTIAHGAHLDLTSRFHY